MTRIRSWSLLVALAIATGILLGAVGRAQDKDRPVRALLVIGGCCHDYGKQKDILTKGISARANVQWVIAYDKDTSTKHLNPVYEKPDWAKGFDVIVHDECSADVKDLDVVNRILEPHRQGVPAVLLHCAMHSYRTPGYPKVTPWFEFTGLQSTGHGPQLPIDINYVEKESPITKDLPNLKTSELTKGVSNWTTAKEELYNNSVGKLLPTATPLARGKQRNDNVVVVWTNNYNGKARVFATTLGHNNETVGDPRYLDLVTRGLLWSVNKLDQAHLRPAEKVLLEEK